MKNGGIIIFLLTVGAVQGYAQCQWLAIEAIADLQDSLSTHFPTICKKVTIGSSVSGHDIVAMKFSDNAQSDEAEPEVLLTSCIHGDEGNPEQVMMKLARRLCLDYGTDPITTELIDNREIWIIAIMNPDGIRGINYFNRSNANGIDLNRNYGYMWNAEDFDPHENSEPETKSVRDFILSRNFNVMIDYHSGLQGIIYPWYYKEGDCPDNQEIEYLANQYDMESGYPAGEFTVTSGYELYQTNGTMAEFAYGSLGIYSFAVELMNFTDWNYDNCELYELNRPAIYMMAQKAGEGITGMVTDANSGRALQAKIEVEGKVPSYSSDVLGDYHRYLRPGNYNITVSASGYAPQSASVSVVNGVASAYNFQLVENNLFAAQKIITCRNYNNAEDPAETWKALGINDGQFYALGDTGYVVLDMLAPILDGSGDDITIHGNANSTGNEFEAFYSGSIDGPWTSMGMGNGTSSFDLDGATSARYIRIEDNGDGPSNTLGAGFNLDAVTAGQIMVGISETELASRIRVYPNPVKDQLNIDHGDVKLDLIRVINSHGASVLTTKDSDQLDVKSLPMGIYYIQCFADNSISTLKITKQ